jgi:exopolysaccharide production protein ExoZ
MATKSYEGIQTLRFLAAFLVVVTHATLYTSERLFPGSGFWRDGASGVNIFFVISGFVMVVSAATLADRTEGWQIFIWRRLIRIVPMYWGATTLKLFALVVVPFTVLHSQLNMTHILSSYLFIPTTNVEGEFKPLLAVGWTLYFEMFFYSLFALALYLRVNIYYFIGTILTVFASLSVFQTAGSPASTMFFDPIVLQFYFGMLVAALVSRDGLLRQVAARYPILPGSLSLLGTILLLAPLRFSTFPDAFRTGVLATIIVLGVALLEPLLKGRIPQLLLILGDASFSLYLFHPLIAPAVPMALQKLGIQNFSISVGLSIIISISVGVAIYFALERPLTRKLRSMNRSPAGRGVGISTLHN